MSSNIAKIVELSCQLLPGKPESVAGSSSVAGANPEAELDSTAWEQNALFKGVLSSIGTPQTGGLDFTPQQQLQQKTRIKEVIAAKGTVKAPNFMPQPQQATTQVAEEPGSFAAVTQAAADALMEPAGPKLCSGLQAEAGLRLAERHSEIMSQVCMLTNLIILSE